MEQIWKQVIVFLSAALVAIRGAPPILYLNQEMQEIGMQRSPFTSREWMCLALCCPVENEQELSENFTNHEQCFPDMCTDVCNTVCCVSCMVTPILAGNFVLDSKNCLKHTCEVTENGTQWQEEPLPCKTCGSGFVNIPGQCCPHCISREPGEWSEWSECSVTCGEGLQSSVRTCYGGESKPTSHCPIPTLRTQTCHRSCPVHCQWEWTDYSECSASCGGGVQVRRVVITQEEEQGGEPCPEDIRNITERRECNTTTCSKSCEWIWSEMSECTVTCGGGTQYRYPILSQAPSRGGEPCPHNIIKNKTERFQCNVHPCPVGCLWKWSDFTDCTSQCVGGQSHNRRRYPIIIQSPRHDGTPCPESVVNNVTEELKCRDEFCLQSRLCRGREVMCDGECITDSDQDCRQDNTDKCPDDPRPEEADRDGDGIGDLCDNCPLIDNKDQTDSDSDGLGNACDNCPYVSNRDQRNRDGDRRGDVCDMCPGQASPIDRDQDRDGWGDHCDNCIYLHNPQQEDRDNDNVGYLCEADKDGDGTVNQYDNCPLVYNPKQEDFDGNRIGDACQQELTQFSEELR